MRGCKLILCALLLCGCCVVKRVYVILPEEKACKCDSTKTYYDIDDFGAPYQIQLPDTVIIIGK